jgi:hypothetical protein
MLMGFTPTDLVGKLGIEKDYPDREGWVPWNSPRRKAQAYDKRRRSITLESGLRILRFF